MAFLPRKQRICLPSLVFSGIYFSAVFQADYGVCAILHSTISWRIEMYYACSMYLVDIVDYCYDLSRPLLWKRKLQNAQHIWIR